MSRPLTMDAAVVHPASPGFRLQWPLVREVLLVAVTGLSLLVALAAVAARQAVPAWASEVESEGDHITSRALADLLLTDPDGVLLVDLRPREEFEAWHLPGSVHFDLPTLLGPKGRAVLDAASRKKVVLVSNGMVHPAQAWVGLAERGYTRVRVLEGGLTDFKREVLTPPGLRGPISEQRAREERARFNAMQRWLHRGS